MLFYMGPACQVDPARQELPTAVSAAAVTALFDGVVALLTHEVVLQQGTDGNRCATRRSGRLLTCATRDIHGP